MSRFRKRKKLHPAIPELLVSKKRVLDEKPLRKKYNPKGHPVRTRTKIRRMIH